MSSGASTGAVAVVVLGVGGGAVSLLAGAVFLVWVDAAARTVLDPQEIPVGVVMSLFGVPAFVAVLHRGRRTA
ncbi:hypothetical protein GCM10010339_55740 [Streptomyces alanosinicus]|uniref:Iron ABC transporter permease n=1 Tax=Streptomyces alanosinicus TaxID=68171 RepID=A0A918YMT1_9ACTN|nr:hypothetical protein GCM10010339_55740 [Streptomyces alanosinicus]